MAFSLVLLFLCAVLLPLFPANGLEHTSKWEKWTHKQTEHPGFGALSTTRKETQSEIVNKHNDLRRAVSPPASNMLKMTWDSNAAANAQKWANKCLYKHSEEQDRMVGKRKCGENIYMSSAPMSWSNAVQSWFDEKNDFVYDVGPKYTNAVVGHYTQVAWYSSYLVGCGIAYCPHQSTLKYYYICQYCPAGNIISREHTPYLQGAPCASCPNHCDNGLCTNACEYEDVYSNCKDLKKQLKCAHALTKNNCQASCHCSDKIY